MEMEHKHHECSGHGSAPSVHQTLNELEFERGIWSAALNGELAEVKKHLAKGEDVDRRDQSGYTALHYASRNGHIDVVKLLKDNRADVNAKTKSGNATPLHRAAYMGHSTILSYLLGHGADPMSLDLDGMTPLHKAAQGNKLESVKVLVEKCPGAKTVEDNRGRTPSNCTTDENVKHILES